MTATPGPGTDGLKRAVWRNAAPIRAIFNRAFAAAGLPCFSPHRVRNTLVDYACKQCRSPEELKAFIQNLGHANVATTLMSYGRSPLTRQMELIRNAGKTEDRDGELRLLMKEISRKLG